MSEHAGRPDGVSRRQFGIAVAGGAAVAAGVVTATRSGPGDVATGSGTSAAATSFGSVTIERATRAARSASGATVGAGHGHGRGSARQPVNQTWADVVVVWLAVHNAQPAVLRVSPGQLRLHIAGGTTVTPRGASTGSLEVPPGADASMWVSYLAPSDAPTAFLAEFTDPVLDHPVGLALPAALPAVTL